MRVMVFVKATEESEAGASVSPEAFEAMERFNDELTAAGILLDGAGLMNSSKGKRIICDGARRTIIDGPFAETRELIAGFSLWQVKDMDEAVAWAMRCPNPMPGLWEIELRQLGEMESFEEAGDTPDGGENRYRMREI